MKFLKLNVHYKLKLNFNSLTLWIIISFGVFVVCVSSRTHSETGTPSWARFCGVDKDHQKVYQDVFSDKCRAGAWFGKNEIQWKCLCTMGAWALRFSWCDGEKPVQGLGSSGFARFTTPELSCFQIAQDVTKGQVLEGILSLGKWSNRFKEGAPLIWTKAVGGTVLTRRDLVLPKIKQLPLVANVSTIYALRSLPRPGTYWSIICDETYTAVCLEPPSSTGDSVATTTTTLFSYEISHLWTTNTSINSRIHLNFDMEPDCNNKKYRHYVWRNIKPKSLSEYILPKVNLDHLHEDCRGCLSVGSPYEISTTTEKCYPNDADNLTALGNEVDLQSERLAEHLGQKILMNKTGAMIIKDIPEMSFLTKGAIMAFGACNMNYIPKQFYQFFLILVEALLSESYIKYPPNPLAKDKFDQILKILDTCMTYTEPFKIHPDNSCPPVFDTYEVPGQENALKADIFEEIMADPKKHDYIVEFIFKIVSFIHYHCYPHFKEAPFLHDVLQVQMESIFRDDLLMRWAFPSHSFEMLQQLFKIHFDLKVTMENFEKCVVMTHNMNNYKGVLKKPINQPDIQFELNKKRRRRRSLTSTSKSYQNEGGYIRIQRHLDTVGTDHSDHPESSRSQSKHGNSYNDESDKANGDDKDYVNSVSPDGDDNDAVRLTWLENQKLINWPQDTDKYDEDSFPANNDTGKFRGDINFACLESLPEFAEMNPQYDLYGRQCWDLDQYGLRPFPKYLEF